MAVLFSDVQQPESEAQIVELLASAQAVESPEAQHSSAGAEQPDGEHPGSAMFAC